MPGNLSVGHQMKRVAFAGSVLLLCWGVWSCGSSEGGPSATDELVADEAQGPSEVSFELVGPGASLDSVNAVTAFACRDDAMFVSVRAGQSSGIHKLSLKDPGSGWRYIYPREAFLETTEDRLIAAFPPGES